jgi:hypothetical protein
MIRVVAAKPLSNSLIWVRFSDGVEAEIDLSDELHGPVFEPLRDPEFFRKLKVNHDIHTVVWPNGADFAPEFLYARVAVPA